MKEVSTYFQQQLRTHSNGQRVINYLKQRGLSGQIAKDFGIGYAPPGWDNLIKQYKHSEDTLSKLLTAGLLIKKSDAKHYDRFRDRIMFPITDRRGRVIGFGGRVLGDEQPKYLNSPETPIFHKGQELYGLFEAQQIHKNLNQILVVEGYMDVVALAQHGIDYAVATLGTAITAKHLQILFRHCHKLIFCFDGDQAGLDAAWRAVETMLPSMQDGWQAHFIFLPEGDDPDSVIRREGRSGFQELIEQSTPLSDYLFKTLNNKVDMNSMDGRARLAKLAAPLLFQIPKGVFKHMMLERLAQQVRVSVENLNSLIKVPANIKSMAKSPNQREIQDTKRLRSPSTIRLALALVIQHPFLAKTDIDINKLSTIKAPGLILLIQLLEFIKQNPKLTTGAILEHWRDKEAFQELSKLAFWEHCVPEVGLEQEFRDILQRLCEFGREQQIEALFQKASQEGLSTAEKRTLQELIGAQQESC